MSLATETHGNSCLPPEFYQEFFRKHPGNSNWYSPINNSGNIPSGWAWMGFPSTRVNSTPQSNET